MLISHNRHHINVGFIIYALTDVRTVLSTSIIYALIDVSTVSSAIEGAVLGVLAAILVFLQNWLRIY